MCADSVSRPFASVWDQMVALSNGGLDATAPEGKSLSVELAELEAYRAGSEEIRLEHLALALSRSPLWHAVLDEMGLDYDRLRQLLCCVLPAPAPHPTCSVLAVVRRARALCGAAGGSNDAAEPCGLHLLQALFETEHEVAQVMARESRAPYSEVVRKWHVIWRLLTDS